MNRLKILIVDDEEEIVSLLSRMLRKQGYIVFSANTLENGRQILQSDSPDIVFLDINLPDGNGLVQLKEIKERKPNTKVIMISAFDMKEYRNAAEEHGADTFLSKPFSLSQVSDLILKFGR